MTTEQQIVDELKLRFQEPCFCKWFVVNNGLPTRERTYSAYVRVTPHGEIHPGRVPVAVRGDNLLPAARPLPIPANASAEHIKELEAEVERLRTQLGHMIWLVEVEWKKNGGPIVADAKRLLEPAGNAALAGTLETSKSKNENQETTNRN